MPPEHTLIIEGKASYMDKIRAFEKDMVEKHQQAIQKTFYNKVDVTDPKIFY